MLYDFGPRLLKLRKDKNLTQQMVVERAKGFDPNLRLSDSVLGKYESDLAVPRLTEAAALADVLNVSLDYLTSGEKCNVLSLKELSPEQVQLLMDLTAYIRTKKRRSQGHKNAPKPTTEALYRTRSDCLAAIWFDAPPNGNGYISSSASSGCIF